MDSVFLIISMVSIVAFAALAVMGVVNLVKRDKAKAIKSFKNSGISVIVAIATFIGFGVTHESEEITEPAQKVVAVNADEPKEEAEEETKKEAEEKVAAEQKAKEKAEAKEKERAEKAAKEEAEKKAKEEAAAKAELEKKQNAQTIPYAQLKKNPDRHAGEYVKYTGEIIQILESGNTTAIRLAVTNTDYGYDYDDIIYIEYDGLTDFVDNDIVTVYGEIYGSFTYESQAGFNITLPGLIAESVE